MNDLGITYPQYLVLLTLWQDGAATMRAIADRLKLSPNAVTPLVDRLVDQGLVTRRRHTDDRRRVEIELTTLGVELEQRASVVQANVECQTSFDSDEIAKLRGELTALADRMKTGQTTLTDANDRDR